MSRFAAVASVSLAVIAPSVSAQVAAMPAGCTQWIQLGSNLLADGLCCDDVGFVAEMPLPSPNYVNDSAARAAGVVGTAYARSTPNRMQSSMSMSYPSAFFLHNSMVDTFTISGPPGTAGTSVTATVSMRTTGTLFVQSGGNNMFIGGSLIRTEIGSWSPSTDAAFNEQFRVQTDPSMTAVTQIRFANHGTVSPTLAVDHTVSGNLVRTVGTPFELAFGLTSEGVGVNVTSLVDWSLPPGYTITSLRGWTDPDSLPCDSIDFNGNGVFPEDQDVLDYLNVLAGGTCGDGNLCGDIDFNNNGVFPEDQDVVDYFNVLAGGSCP